MHLRVNYCLLDSDKIFVTFVLKQLNLIEESQMPGAPLVIPDIFKFLVLLSYEKYHSKAIIDVPKILHLCEGKEVYQDSMHIKVEYFLKEAWIGFLHLHLHWKFELWAGKPAWGVKAKHCWALSTNFWKQKVCWHHPTMFCLITSSKLSNQ